MIPSQQDTSDAAQAYYGKSRGKSSVHACNIVCAQRMKGAEGHLYLIWRFGLHNIKIPG